MELKVNAEYSALLPQLSLSQYEALKNSIRMEGQHYPIAYNVNGDILDGHNRWRICQELGIAPKIEVEPRKFSSVLDEKQFVLETNLLRRHLETWYRIIVAKPLLAIYREKANARMLKGDPTQKFGEGEAVEQFAETVHSNPETVRQALWLEEHAPDKIPELEKGESISKVYREAKHAEAIKELEKKLPFIQEPDGLFDVIVIDPPWSMQGEYDAEHFRGAPPYPLMSVDEIKSWKIPASSNCSLWLWATNTFLHDAFHVLQAWGFEPKTVLTWVKDSIGVGVWLRGQTEHCILATKGKPEIDLHGQSTAFFAKKTGHSQKPDAFYELVASLCKGRRLDYFGRRQREGWSVYGTLENE